MKLIQLLLLTLSLAGIAFPATVDVVVYGATPGGIAAAVAAAKNGRSVVLLEPTAHVGGLATSGLQHPDFRTFEGLTGAFQEFNRRVEAYYRVKYGAESPQVKESLQGTHAEPHVAELVFEQMLGEHKKLTVRKQSVLLRVTVKAKGAVQHIESIDVRNALGATETIVGRQFIDGSYEGDLMATAGVKYRVGREGRDEYGEALAPDKADGQLQAYNFRFVMTTNAANRVMPVAPQGYDRAEFVDVLPLLGTKIKRAFGYPSSAIFKAQIPPIPNGKADINDVSREIVRLSMPGENLEWPEGDAAARAKVFERHLRYNAGLLYFIQNDPAVPAEFRAAAREWGWCKDEFTDNGGLPWQLYVREARRMVGQHVFTERDTDCAPNDARGLLRMDAIAMGDYGPNCHGTSHEGPRYGGKHGGEFYKNVPPYQIRYGVLVPNEVDNLLVPVAASSSHVGFCALRLEPIWMSLGEAAGHAAHLAIKRRDPVQRVNVSELQELLHADGAATLYVSDVPETSPLFRAVQWFGTRGAFHGLAKPGEKGCGERGPNLVGQYYAAYPHHAANLNEPATAMLIERWIGLLPSNVAQAKARRDRRLQTSPLPTRGEALAILYQLR